nr:Protein tssc1 [Polyrhizophydium stewartii]
MLVPPSTAVQVHLIDFDEDHDEITHAAFAHPNEVLSISPAPAAADVFASCARQVAGAATSHQSLLWRFSKIDAEDDGRLRGGSGGSLEQVSALSPGSQLTAIHHESARIDKAHELSVRCLDFNPNKAHQIVSGGDDCKIRIWDTRNTKTFVKEVSDHTHCKTTDGLVASFDQHEEAVYSVAWSAADPWIFASLSYDGRVVVNQVPRDHKYKIIL